MSNEQLLNSMPTADLVKELVKRDGVNCGAIDNKNFVSAIFINGKDVFNICLERGNQQ